MEEIRAESWGHLHELLFADSWRERLQRFRSDFAFRGRARADESLVPSLVRLGGETRRLETHLLRNFRKYAARGDGARRLGLELAGAGPAPRPPDAAARLDLLALRRAALRDRRPQRGTTRTASSGASTTCARTSCCPSGSAPRSTEEGANALHAGDARRGGADDRPTSSAWARSRSSLFLEPPSLDERIVNQYALFSLVLGPALPLDRWLETAPELARRVVVPAALKWEVRDKLDQANITERVLFPGLDGLSPLARTALPTRPRHVPTGPGRRRLGPGHP